VAFVPTARHLLRARDLADARYFEPLGVDDLARAAGLSRAHFSREFRRAFGESPHAYLLTRRLERAAALMRNTDRSIADICFSVGLQSVGSFTTSFTRTYGVSPTAYRAAFPPAASRAMPPTCVLRAYGRPPVARANGSSTVAGAPKRPPFARAPGHSPVVGGRAQHSTFREDSDPARD
jgi:AraC-like DNA-binding protein